MKTEFEIMLEAAIQANGMKIVEAQEEQNQAKTTAMVQAYTILEFKLRNENAAMREALMAYRRQMKAGDLK
jgi:hypothetical protein